MVDHTNNRMANRYSIWRPSRVHCACSAVRPAETIVVEDSSHTDDTAPTYVVRYAEPRPGRAPVGKASSRVEDEDLVRLSDGGWLRGEVMNYLSPKMGAQVSDLDCLIQVPSKWASVDVVGDVEVASSYLFDAIRICPCRGAAWVDPDYLRTKLTGLALPVCRCNHWFCIIALLSRYEGAALPQVTLVSVDSMARDRSTELNIVAT